MFAIARKTSFFYFTHLCTFCLPAWPVLLEGKKGGIVSMLEFWVPLWLSSSVLWSEKQESYALLHTLPVTDREIVRAKFGLALAAVFVHWLILSLFTWWAWGSSWEYPFDVASNPSVLPGVVTYEARTPSRSRLSSPALERFSPLDALTAFIREKGQQIVRSYGYYSNKARGLRRKRQKSPAGITPLQSTLPETEQDDFRRH